MTTYNKKFFEFVSVSFVAFCVFFGVWFFVYKVGLNTLPIQSEDTLPALVMPVTLLKSQTLYADSVYQEIIRRYPHPDDKSYTKGLTPFYFKKIAGHYISAFPIMTGILAVPVYYLPLMYGMPVNWDNLILLSHIASALIVAVSGGFFYLLVRYGFDLSEKDSELLTNIYLFGTINFALVSQSLWQHGTVQLFLILGLIFLQQIPKSNQKYLNVFMMSLFLGFAVLSRPTSLLALVFLFILVLEKTNTLNYENFKKLSLSGFGQLVIDALKSGSVYILGLLPAVLFFVYYNNAYYLDVNNQGYSSQLLSSWLSRFPEGFLGLWISPSKGILVFSPIFIFSLLSVYFIYKNGGFKKHLNYLVFFAIVIVHTLALGMWKHWYGGWSFGYRMAADVIPFLVMLLIPAIKSAKYINFKPIFTVLFGFSVLVQLYGMVFFDGIWHAAYDRGYVNTSWLWSLSDSQFAFDTRRVLVKMKVLEKACPKCLPVDTAQIEQIVQPF